jgi:4'-phosphopantetheinyl transferase EntD
MSPEHPAAAAADAVLPVGVQESPAIAALFPEPVAAFDAQVDHCQGTLDPREAAGATRMLESRRREFTAGRLCARAALQRLGFGPTPVPRAADRAPVWPDGVIASIAHKDGYCAVAATRQGRMIAIGLDVERWQPLPVRWGLCLTPGEIAWLEDQAPGDRGALAMVFFSAKEAVYKCQYPLTRRWLGFHDVEVELDVARQAFRVQFPAGLDRRLLVMARQVGRYSCRNGWLLTGLAVLAEPDAAT